VTKCGAPCCSFFSVIDIFDAHKIGLRTNCTSTSRQSDWDADGYRVMTNEIVTTKLGV
jgi:hypothetical protein